MLLLRNIPATIPLSSLQSSIRPSSEFMNAQIEHLNTLNLASSDRHTTCYTCSTRKF